MVREEMMEEEQKHLFHVTWVTHNSRVSERMKKYNVRKSKGVWLSLENEIEVTRYAAEVVIQDAIKLLAYNICGDHVHLILFCADIGRDKIIQKLKSVSARKFLKRLRDIQSHQEQGVMTPCSSSIGNHLWAQKI